MPLLPHTSRPLFSAAADQFTRRLEASVTYAICTQLENLGWIVDETHPGNNVTQQRARTKRQEQALRAASGGNPRFPDFVLYQSGTNRPISVIEAKRPGQPLEEALRQGVECYARPLDAPLVFAYNDTFVVARNVQNGHPLKIDGEDVRQFIDQFTSLRFINEGAEILSAPESIQISREHLIQVFKHQSDLLREAGLTAGHERFGALSDVLFLKLMDEVSQLELHAGGSPTLPNRLQWSYWSSQSPTDRLDYVRNVVWAEMNQRFGDIFGRDFPITDPKIFNDMVESLSDLNFTSADADVKGDAFEYFLKNAYQGVGIKDLGEYFTPRNIVRTMVSMVDPKVGETVYDPFCGTGGFMIEAFRYVSLRTKPNDKLNQVLKSETVYGSEISDTARVARMNMILYGDGHSNVERRDSFNNPVDSRYDIVVTNPPFALKSRHGNLYPLPTTNGDALAIQHCLKALKPDGRAAILVKNDILTKGGIIGKVRDHLLASVNDLTVVSLPRGLFEPYTPTKTSILVFKRDGKRPSVFFFNVRQVGHEFGAKKKSIPSNDLPTMLSAFQGDDSAATKVGSIEIQRDTIRRSDNSLFMFDYAESLPPIAKHRPTMRLGDLIAPSGTRIDPSDAPETPFDLLEVSKIRGVNVSKETFGADLSQPYVQVAGGDVVYNPHRVNIGSIGLVPESLTGGLVSHIYPVFRVVDESQYPPLFLIRTLQSPGFLQVIEDYGARTGAVRSNLSFEQLSRIRVPILSADELSDIMDIERQMREHEQWLAKLREQHGSVVRVGITQSTP